MINDDDFKIFPTRDSFGAGLDMERKMIAAVGGPNTIRTRIQENADGSTTILKTRGGMPTFSTTQPPVYAPTITYPYAYLETGILADLRVAGGAATWKGLDIVGTGKYMKWVSTGLDTLGQHKSGSLDDGPSLSVVTDAKKDMAVKIPPSVFSGKMRLFIQAVYGAKDIVGYSLVDNGLMEFEESYLAIPPLEVAKYPNRMAATYVTTEDFRPRSYSLHFEETGVGSIELGFTSANSCGIFVSNNTYWLIRISREGTVFTVTAYPITNDTLVDSFKTKLGGSGNSAETIAQCEAYMFAYSYPSIAGAITLGSYDLGAGGEGDPMAYGWKFNPDGSEAKMVIHQLTPTTLANMRWVSRTLTMSLSFDPDVSPLSAESFTCSITSQNNGSWSNPRGIILYAPCFEGIDPAAEYSTRVQITSIASGLFAGDPDGMAEVVDMPIYGFYLNNVWKPLLLSRKQGPDKWHVKINGSNLTSWDYLPYGYAGSDVSNIDTVIVDSYEAAYLSPFQSYHDSASIGQVYHYQWEATRGTNYILSIDSTTATGYQPAYNMGTTPPADQLSYKETILNSASAGDPANIPGYYGPFSGINVLNTATARNEQIGASIIEKDNAFINKYSYPIIDSDSILTTEYTEAIEVTSEVTRWYRNEIGDLVSATIPCGDAEAVYLLAGLGDEWVQYHHSISSSTFASKVKITRKISWWDSTPPGSHWDETETLYEGTYDAQFMVAPGNNDSVIKPQLPKTDWSKYISKAGVKVCSREPDSITYWGPQSAYYDDGMYSFTSVLSHFNSSEGPRSDSSMDRYTRFCGWI